MENITGIAFTKNRFKKSQQVVICLSEQVATLSLENKSLTSDHSALKSEHKNDIHNSQPPSLGGLYKKSSNLRKSSNKKSGGQQGYKGSTLRFQGKIDKKMPLKAKHAADGTANCSKPYRNRRKSTFNKIIRQELIVLCEQVKEKNQKTPAYNHPVRGEPKRIEGYILLIVLNKFHQEILSFLTNPAVSFDNNLAVRVLIKTKLKISDCFRSFEGEKTFASIVSYISTLKKQRINILQAMNKIIQPPSIRFRTVSNSLIII